MRLLVGLGALVLLASSVPAHAQSQGMAGSTGVPLNSTSNAINAKGAGSLSTFTFPFITPLPTTYFRMGVTNGSSMDFVPSSFMAYDQVVAKGIADLAVKPKSIVQVAQEYRNMEHEKAQTTFVQDGSGKIVKASN